MSMGFKKSIRKMKIAANSPWSLHSNLHALRWDGWRAGKRSRGGADTDYGGDNSRCHLQSMDCMPSNVSQWSSTWHAQQNVRLVEFVDAEPVDMDFGIRRGPGTNPHGYRGMTV